MYDHADSLQLFAAKMDIADQNEEHTRLFLRKFVSFGHPFPTPVTLVVGRKCLIKV